MPATPAAQSLVQEIEHKLREEEWLIFEWSPIHLRNLLGQWYLKEGATEVNALKVWQDSCQYLYLPRLVNDQVFRNAIVQGVESEDYFGFASGKEEDRYLGFVFGQNAVVNLDETALFIEREAAAEYKARTERPSELGGGGEVQPPGGVIPPDGPGEQPPSPPTAAGQARTQFYGTVSLNPVKAKMDFATIVDEVVEQFTSRLGVDVRISVEIQAKANLGFDDSVQRSVKENCNMLKFGSAEFEGGE